MADSFVGAPDSEIVSRLRNGSESALAELMKRYFDDVAEVAFHYLRSPDSARDVAQDVFIRVWHRREGLDASKPIIHYLRRAARNRAYDILSNDATTQRTIDRAIGAQNSEQLYDINAGPGVLEQDEVDAAVYKAAQGLTPRVREVALLYYRGLQPGEIAELLEVAPRTVYNQLRTAIPILARALGSQ